MAKPKYRLTYSEPYEFDDDDSQSSGHDINWSRSTIEFEADNDDLAKDIVNEFVKNEIKILDEKLYRKPIELVKIIELQ